ncbi:family 20 glycosylhydrolase [Amycolatopsis cihanbeyliensis]|uniref:beta-N-acetylhexosaminidase n=1 Tax=Amycolatopsis cihanbeyliensis TaxID=1128664 RepID=A0A542DQV7_AMYCI|nr:hexosaminidase [Amycolatopsis cihanbeyliensis]
MQMRKARNPRTRIGYAFSVLAVAVGMVAGSALAVEQPAAAAALESPQDIVPAPVSVEPADGVVHDLTADTTIYTEGGSAEARAVGEQLAGLLRGSTGYPFPVTDAQGQPTDGVSLLLSGADPQVGAEGYQLDVTGESVVLRANEAAGLFAGTQTLRQLLPAKVESATEQDGPWQLAGVSVTDYPRFHHRGAMLDIARHFHPVDTVKRYIDQLSLYKVNYLHLHLADDQGWRLVIDSWPRLATYGGSTEVGGGPGGYYTKADYSEIVDYAASKHITVIPEIDMPGHTNAALASYAELNCDGQAPPLRTDIEVGYSSLCIDKEITYEFVDDVIREVAALTPGPYIHIGGDEANATTPADYETFMDRVLPIVNKYGKKPMGWHEFVKTTTDTDAVPQFWGTTTSNQVVADAVQRGNKVLMSPANKAYLDMKYNSSTPLGLNWAGYTEVDDAYDWNPGSYLSGVPESAVRGVEAPLWTETIETPAHIDYMAFPRLPAIAELGWSPWSTHDWNAFRERLGAQAPRWEEMGLEFYRSPQVPWRTGGGEPGECSASAWNDSTVYTGGDQVSHNGHTWTAKWWTRGQEPGTTGEWGVWQDEGPC